jgi:hypothetical protein
MLTIVSQLPKCLQECVILCSRGVQNFCGGDLLDMEMPIRPIGCLVVSFNEMWILGRILSMTPKSFKSVLFYSFKYHYECLRLSRNFNFQNGDEYLEFEELFSFTPRHSSLCFDMCFTSIDSCHVLELL